MAKTKVDIQAELTALTKIKRTAGESFQAWAKKVTKKAYELPEDDWNDLSDQAWNWLEAANKARKIANADLPVFEGAIDDEEEGEESEREQNDDPDPEEEADPEEGDGEPEEEPEAPPPPVKPKAEKSKPAKPEPEPAKPAPAKAVMNKASKNPAILTPSGDPISQSKAYRLLCLENIGKKPSEIREIATLDKRFTLNKISMDSIYHHTKDVLAALKEHYGMELPSAVKTEETTPSRKRS